MSQKNDFGVLYVVQAPSRLNRSRKDYILDELKELSKEELIKIRKDIVELINDKYNGCYKILQGI